MSLIKQLWLALIAIMVLSFGGTFIISTLGARNYLQEQLYLKNQDNAASLALAITQLDKDPVTLELLVGAHFDSGHYRQISLTDPSGKTLVELINQPVKSTVPDWFVKLIPIEVEPGVAQIQDGWQLFATLTLLSHDRFAYQVLWNEAVELAGWFLAGLVVCGLVGSGIVRIITRPVTAVVNQAEAIGARQFVMIDEPGTVEFRRVVRAMNQLSDRVRTMLEEETNRLEKLRFVAHFDPLTGLAGRQHFLDSIESFMSHEESTTGSLVIARVAGLDELNRQLGWQVVDQLLSRIGESLQLLLADNPGWMAGRIAGADFALLTPEEGDTLNVARELSARAHLAIDDANLNGERLLPVGGTQFNSGEQVSTVLSRADGALIMAEREEGQAIQVSAPSSNGFSRSDLVSWRTALAESMERDGVRLAEYPVVGRDGNALHFEAPVRLCLGDSWKPAAYFMPWAARLGMLPQIDSRVIQAALTTLQTSDRPLGVHVSAEAVCDQQFRAETLRLLESHHAEAEKLWLEIPESAAFRQLTEFRSLCRELKSFGCRIGLEHVGCHFSRINELQELGLDFIKVDGALIRGASDNTSSQAFLRGLCTIAHAVGLKVMAEGVRHENEPAGLFELGFDGVTGPGVKL